MQQLFIWPSCTLCWTKDSSFLHATTSIYLRARFINSPLNHKMQIGNGTQQSTSMLEVTEEPSMYLNQGLLSHEYHFLSNEYALRSSYWSWQAGHVGHCIVRSDLLSMIGVRGRHLSGDTSISLSMILLLDPYLLFLPTRLQTSVVKNPCKNLCVFQILRWTRLLRWRW
jgi:hypothetical protein